MRLNPSTHTVVCCTSTAGVWCRCHGMSGWEAVSSQLPVVLSRKHTAEPLRGALKREGRKEVEGGWGLAPTPALRFWFDSVRQHLAQILAFPIGSHGLQPHMWPHSSFIGGKSGTFLGEVTGIEVKKTSSGRAQTGPHFPNSQTNRFVLQSSSPMHAHLWVHTHKHIHTHQINQWYQAFKLRKWKQSTIKRQKKC